MVSLAQQRRHPRVKVSWPVTILTRKGPIAGEVTDISLGGAFISCQDSPEPSERFRLAVKLDLPPHFLFMDARVARSTLYGPGGKQCAARGGIGVRFVDVGGKERAFLEELVARQQQDPGASTLSSP